MRTIEDKSSLTLARRYSFIPYSCTLNYFAHMFRNWDRVQHESRNVGLHNFGFEGDASLEWRVLGPIAFPIPSGVIASNQCRYRTEVSICGSSGFTPGSHKASLKSFYI